MAKINTTLGQACTLKAGKFVAASDITEEYQEGMYPCYGGNGIRGYVADYSHEGTYPLIGRQGALCGNVNYATGKFRATEHAVVVQPNLPMNVRWLYYKLLSMDLGQYATGAAQPGLAVAKLEQLPFAVPPMDEQNDLVELCDNVNNLISLRKQQIAKLDELVKARFVEMFGDPVENPMCWTTHPLDTVCNTIVDCSHSTPSYTTNDTGFMCIRTSIVKKNKILWDEIEYIPEEEYNKRIQRKKPVKGDIVYTREGAILGIAAIIDRDCNVALGQRSMLLSPNHEKCCSEFLCVAMNFDSFLLKALGGISGSASPHINVGDIKAFDIILPPLELQHQFAAFIAQTDQQELTIQQSLAKLELLKKALMQKYFG